MRMSKYAMAAALAAITWGHSAYGQQFNYSGQAADPAPVSSARQVSYDYYSTPDGGQQQASFSSASYVAKDDGAAAPADAPADAPAEEEKCYRWPYGCKLADMGEQKHWLQNECMTANNTTAGGWVAQSFVWNPYHPANNFNGPVTWTDRANQYQLNETYVFLGKQVKTDGCGWDWGYRADGFYGTNYRWDTSGGFETGWSTNSQFLGFAVPQLYAEVAKDDWTIRAGRYISPVGYYTVGTANNFFNTIPYTYQWGEPFTHTGVLVTRKWSDKLTTSSGLTHGWDNTTNAGNPHIGMINTATWTIDQKRSLAWVQVYGCEPSQNTNGVGVAGNGTPYTPRYFQTLVYTKKLSDDVMWVLQSDFGRQTNAITTPGGLNQTAMWYGVNTYLYWNMTGQTQWGLNGEWFRDQGGFRVGNAVPSFGSPHARGFASSGFNGEFWRMTFGPKHYFTPNFYGRANLLCDWYTGADARNIAPGSAGGKAFDNGKLNYQQALMLDCVFTF